MRITGIFSISAVCMCVLLAGQVFATTTPTANTPTVASPTRGTPTNTPTTAVPTTSTATTGIPTTRTATPPTNTPTNTRTNTRTSTPTITSTPTDKCGTPYGEIEPSGNIDQHADGTWYSPIGADSTYTAVNYGDKDWNGTECVDDSILTAKWDAVNFTPATSYGVSTNLKAVADPAEGSVTLSLDDAGYIVEDGGYVEVDSMDVSIIIPDKETTSAADVRSCTQADPAKPYGCNNYYSGTVAKDGVTLSFDHCVVCEDGWSGYTQNTCGFGNPSIGACETSLALSGNKWSSDHVSVCHSDDTNYPSGCTSTFTTNWKIKAPGGSWHLYHTPTYTYNTADKLSNITCTRSSL